jgi:thiol-disulfide isomerase/thioredoxin
MAVAAVTDAEFNSIINENDKVIVKYFADWCGSCKLFAPKFRRLSENADYEGVIFIEVNAEENEEARKAAGVNNLPFLATFKSGELLTGKPTSKEDRAVEMLNELKA